MSDVEMMMVSGFLVLLAIGIVLMFAPVNSGEEPPGPVLREIEPHVGEGDALIDFRYSIRRIQEAADAETPSDESVAAVKLEQPVPDLEEDRAASEPAPRVGDEVFYLAATREVEGQNRQPGLWAKVIALNEGDERKAKYHYIRLRASQMIDRLSATNTDENGSTNTRGLDTTMPAVPERKHDPDPIAGTNDKRPVLEREFVIDAIAKHASIADLIEAARLLGNFSVREYITADDIRRKVAADQTMKTDASSFFDNYAHRTSVNVNDILERFDAESVKHYVEARQFPHDTRVDFFDEAVVVTILPGSPRMEFLVLAPRGGLDEEFAIKFLTSSRITELFVAAAAEPGGALSLYVELDRLLERLRTG